jgi:GNAT superfamily N-acetyltransferase
MSALRHRAALLDDAEAIAALHAASWQTTYRGAFTDAYLDGDVLTERRAVWHERLSQPAPHQHVIVAEEEGRLVGFACAFGNDDPRWGTQLDNLHVRRDEQGRSIGADLLAAVARWSLAAHPGAGLYLFVLVQNHGARRFYDRLEGRDVGPEVWLTPDGSSVPTRRYAWSPESLMRLVRARPALSPESG